jgi:type IV secretory pathway protease TraF
MHIIKRVSTVNNNSIYVLGDNPKNSLDSRLFGDINKKQVIGKGKMVIRENMVMSLTLKPN